MQIHATDLVVGMYIVKLDQAWSKTPFFKHQFLISSVEQLKQLKSICQTVEIDLGQSKLNRESFVKFSSKYPAVEQSVKIEIDRSAKFLNLIFDDIAHSRSIACKSVQKAIQQIATSVLASGNISDYYEKYLAPHPELVQKSLRTLMLTTSFAKHITLNKNKLMSLATAALLHDIGMATIPPAILAKPRLSNEEQSLVQSHVSASIYLLSELKSIDKEVIEIVAQHHENLDGSGYGQGLARSQISFSAKILRLVTIYEALTRDRTYAAKKTKLQALTQLVQLADNQKISKNLVSKFIEMLAIYPTNTLLKLHNEQTVLVLQDQKDYQTKAENDLILVESVEAPNELLTVTRTSVATVVHMFDRQGA